MTRYQFPSAGFLILGVLSRPFKNVVVVAGENAFTSETFTQTLALAERNDARVSVIDVIDPMP